MKERSGPTAVIWDMDGTLIDQTGPIIRCFTDVITNLGYPEPDPDRIRRSMGGPMASTMALFVDADRLEQAGIAFRKRFPEIMLEGLVILPGAKACVDYFAKRNIPQAILTNKHGETARAVSQHCGFAEKIDVCIGNTDTNWHKPEAALTWHVLKMCGTKPEGAILVGDSPTDVSTAKNAGIGCVGVATGAHSKEELLEAGAISAYDGLTEYLNYLGTRLP